MSQNDRKKRVLIFTLSPPLPATTGESIYAINTVLPLADEVEYHLFCIGGPDAGRHVAAHADTYREYFHSVHIEPRAPLPLEKSFVGRVLHVVNHIVFRLPFMDASYFSWAAVHNARRIVRKQKIDLLEINSPHLAFFKRFIRLPALLVNHNIESDLFPFWVPSGLSRVKHRLASALATVSRRNARRVEIENCWGFYAETFISQNDLQRVTAQVPKYYLPLCMPVTGTSYAAKPADACHFLWLGGGAWYPNADALVWFVDAIYPLVRDELARKRMVLHFVGSHPPPDLVAIGGDKNVEVHGFVDSLAPILAIAHVLFVPLRIGGGVRVKVLEAMGHGIPVLSTSKGCEGLGALDGRDVLVRDDAEAFAQAMLDLVDAPDVRARLARAGRDLLRKNFDIGNCLDIKRRLYVMAGSTPVSAG